MKIGLAILAYVCFLFSALGVFRAMIEIMARYKDKRWIRIGFTVAIIAGVLGAAIMLLSRNLK